MPTRKNNYIQLAIYIGLVLIGGLLAVSIQYFSGQLSIGDSSPEEIREGGFSFINPLLECEVAHGSIDARKQNFKKDLESYIDKIRQENGLETMAVYFRDLNNGPAFGVHEEMQFIPASLLKVPIMIAYFKLAEKDAGILDKKLSFAKKIDLPAAKNIQTIEPSHALELGKIYTVRELIEHSILYSDNQAVALLYENIPESALSDLYTLLGINEAVAAPGGTISVTDYSRFFRVLFNSSYLNREYSSEALRLLSLAEYKNALLAGIPDDVKVAHKFGESGNTTTRQLHDCGIVYYPNHPYLLCIMSKGTSLPGLEKSIGDVSAFVYQKINSQYPR